MTDRLNSLLVSFTHDIRDDDAQALISAISMLKGVLKVTPNVTHCMDEYTYRARLKCEIRDLIFKFLEKD